MGRPPELRVHVHEGPDVLAGDAEHAVDHRGGCPPADRDLAVARLAAHPTEARVPLLPDVPVPAHDGAAGRGRVGFVYLFNPTFGPINQGLKTLGVDNPPLWFYSAYWSKWGLVFLSLWGVGQTMMIFLAGLLDVPRQLYEAAEIEGASSWQRFRYVTLPMISPVMFFSVVIGVIAGFQYFTQAYVASFAVSGQPHGGRVVQHRRAGGIDPLLLVAPVHQGVRPLPDGLRLRDGLDPLPDHHGLHDRDHQDVATVGPLPGGVPIATETTTRPVPPTAPPRPLRPIPPAVRRRRFLTEVGNHAALIAVSIMFLLPMAFIVLTALMTDRQAKTPDFWPHPFQWGNFIDVFDRIPLLRYTLNTVTISTLATVGVVVSCIPVAYALSRMRWRGRNASFLIVLSTIMLPVQVTIVPLYILFVRFGWIGTMKPLIVPLFFGDAFTIFLLRQFFLTIPSELSDAARVDGASEFQIMTRVIVPLAKPAIAAVALFQFLYSWNDFFSPLLFLIQDPDKWTLSLALSEFRSQYHVEWNLTMAAAVLFVMPVIILFFLAQRAFIEGVTLTGTKG